MAPAGRCQILEVTPAEAWEGLESDGSSILIDVRTRAEWKYVGIPDLHGLDREVILIEWRSYPQLQVNSEFLSELNKAIGESVPDNIYFICRSGARSLEAAQVTAEELNSRGAAANCVNVLEGFEGDLDANGHRGSVNGWKVRSLPWRQN